MPPSLPPLLGDVAVRPDHNLRVINECRRRYLAALTDYLRTPCGQTHARQLLATGHQPRSLETR